MDYWRGEDVVGKTIQQHVDKINTCTTISNFLLFQWRRSDVQPRRRGLTVALTSVKKILTIE